jgi:hypothetical protein
VHIALDEDRAHALAEEWRTTGLQRVGLEILECPDRRLTRVAVECVARELADGETEVSVLLPDRKYKGLWHRVLHDRTADAILTEVSRLPHANVTTVPFHLDQLDAPKVPLSDLLSRRRNGGAPGLAEVAPLPQDEREDTFGVLPGCTPLADVRWRARVRVGGRVRSMRIAPQHDAPTLELVLVDGTGGLSVVFLGRRGLAGVDVGSTLLVEGTVGIHRARLAILNPTYTLVG